MNKLFKKSATITTSNNDTYKIESGRYFIMPKFGKKRIKHQYGNACKITRIDKNQDEVLSPNDVSFIGEIFSFENNRLRFLQSTYTDVKAFDTELHDNGKELPITVIETYGDKTSRISSIGDIVKFESDIKEQSYVIDIKVLKLLMKEKSKHKKDL